MNQGLLRLEWIRFHRHMMILDSAMKQVLATASVVLLIHFDYQVMLLCFMCLKNIFICTSVFGIGFAFQTCRIVSGWQCLLDLTGHLHPLIAHSL